MKPFTLEWWIEQQNKLISDSLYLLMKYHLRNDRRARRKSIRYREIVEWIQKRIITKYGEQNETTKKRH